MIGHIIIIPLSCETPEGIELFVERFANVMIGSGLLSVDGVEKIMVRIGDRTFNLIAAPDGETIN
jgi:hypothetical protein